MEYAHTNNIAKDDEIMYTALGYIAHLAFMLSKYLQVNLRYRIIPFSSKSFLKDEIKDPNGEYPLYKKEVERDRYEKAIIFLRKNVEQLLFSRELDPTEGAPILARLKALVDAEATWFLTDRDVSTTVAASITIEAPDILLVNGVCKVIEGWLINGKSWMKKP
jgi:hypothetical protein